MRPWPGCHKFGCFTMWGNDLASGHHKVGCFITNQDISGSLQSKIMTYQSVQDQELSVSEVYITVSGPTSQSRTKTYWSVKYIIVSGQVLSGGQGHYSQGPWSISQSRTIQSKILSLTQSKTVKSRVMIFQSLRDITVSWSISQSRTLQSRTMIYWSAKDIIVSGKDLSVNQGHLSFRPGPITKSRILQSRTMIYQSVKHITVSGQDLSVSHGHYTFRPEPISQSRTIQFQAKTYKSV